MSYGIVFGALLAMLLFGGFIGGLVWWVRRPISSRRQSNGVLPLFGHDRAVVYARAEDDGDEEDDRAQLIMARAPHRSTVSNGALPSTPVTGTNGAATGMGRTASNAARTASPSWSTPVTRTGYAPMPGASLSDVSTPASTPVSTPVSTPDVTAYDGASIRYSVPTDSTLRFLPGRLEIIGGPDLGRDIRFVHTPGRDAIEVTFGRNEGPPYRHVQLHDATVSRAHARMRFRDGQWLLANLSTTNPVLHNGMIVDGETDRSLAEGDRIEMGEVVFRFHV